MIRFEDGELLNLLPVSMAKDIEIQCISYALQRQIQRIIYHASRTRTVAMIDMLPETVLDVLATELRTPYYQEDMEHRHQAEHHQADAALAYQGGNAKRRGGTDRGCIRRGKHRGVVQL